MSRFWRHFIRNGGGSPGRNYLGLQGCDLPLRHPLPSRSEVAQTRGLGVRAVMPGGPADLAGVRANDVIVRLGERPVTGAEALRDLLVVLPADFPVAVVFLRGGRLVERYLFLCERPDHARRR